MSPISPHSSPVDWWEKNYEVSGSIAEFSNTISNAFFIIVPVIGLKLFWQYGRYVSKGVLWVLVLLMVVGLSSAYFHATLSLLGQLLDELSILWVVALGFGLWLPKHQLPACFRRSRRLFRDALVLVALLSTLISGVQPALNAFVLMTLLIPSVALLVGQLRECTLARVTRLGYISTSVLGLALTCWIIDRFFCSWFSSRVNFHAWWHVLICFGSYFACVLFAYFEAEREASQHSPVLKYWPLNSLGFGIPYVFLETAHHIHLVKPWL